MQKLHELQSYYMSQGIINIISNIISNPVTDYGSHRHCNYCLELYIRRHNCSIKQKIIKLCDDIITFNETIFYFEKSDEFIISGVIPLIKLYNKHLTNKINKYINNIY